jgi:hypothetical protein
MTKESASLRKARKISDELEAANYHSMVGIPEELHRAMSEWLGEKALIQVMRALERIFNNV